MADQTISNFIAKTKSSNKRNITFFIIFISSAFFIIFIPIRELGVAVRENSIWNFILKCTASATLAFIIQYPLFATDPLATGKSKASAFFKSFYPSHQIMQKYTNINEGQATELWFSFFNTWSKPQSKHHHEWRMVFERSYACRLIFYFTKILMLAIIASLMAIFITIVKQINLNFLDIKVETPKLVFLGISIIAYFFLWFNNRPNILNPTGCWQKYREISLMELAILQNEVLSKANTYEDAVRLVEKIGRARK